MLSRHTFVASRALQLQAACTIASPCVSYLYIRAWLALRAHAAGGQHNSQPMLAALWTSSAHLFGLSCKHVWRGAVHVCVLDVAAAPN
jgi:hypothetical protein